MVSRSSSGSRPKSAQPEPPAPLRIEDENEWAWCGERRLDLTPRAFAVLRYLVSHAGRLVTKNELLDNVWSETIVSEAALASCIRDLRKELGDSSRSPQYVETVHRRGFRFIGPLAPVPAAGAASPARAVPAPAVPAPVVPAPPEERATPQLVGREPELERLRALFATALGGRRRVVFVTGEPGIGKTTLVEAFLAEIAPAEGLRIGRGQCVEQYGSGEAYLPVLEALGRLGRDAGGEALVGILRQFAPTWLAELPALLGDDDLAAVQKRAQGSTRERMLRELIEAIDAICKDGPLVLVLEDLHWSDSATIDLLAMLARRRDPARLLILGTYRPADVAAADHPLKPVQQELQVHGHCEEMALDFLSETAVGDWVASRLPGGSIPPRLARVLHRNTSGNPLFLETVIDDWTARGKVRAVDGRWELAAEVDDVDEDVPHTLAQMVEKQIGRLTPREQAVLAVGSIAGAEFSAAIATADGIEVEEAERLCASLARRGPFVRLLGAAEWPDGTVAGRYGFIHAIHRSVLQSQVSIGRRVGLHLRIGARLEQAHAARAAEVAGELAMHFEEGRDFERAIAYRRHAADNALRHHGLREAAGHASRALELLAALPESPERLQQELSIRATLGAALIPRVLTDPEGMRNHARALELCTRLGVTPELVPALVGLSRYYISRVELETARGLTQQLAAVAEKNPDGTIRLVAHTSAGMIACYAGELEAALAELESGVAIYDVPQHRGRWPAYWGGHEAGVSCAVHAAWVLWLLGRPARAAAKLQEAIAWARAHDNPFMLANACSVGAVLQVARGDVAAVLALIDAAALLNTTELGFELFQNLGLVYHGWARSETGEIEKGAADIEEGLTAYRSNGAGLGVPTFLGLLAQARARLGRWSEALAALDEAVAMSESSGARYWDAELRRLRGVLLLESGASNAERDAETCFVEALAIARRQNAKALELRAATSLGRLWHQRKKTAKARKLLAGVFEDFEKELDDSVDLVESRRLLEQLGAGAGREAPRA